MAVSNLSLKLSQMATPLQLQAQQIQTLLTLTTQIPPQSNPHLQSYADFIVVNATRAFELEAVRLDSLLERGHKTADPAPGWQSYALSVQLFHNMPPLTPETLIAAARDGNPELVELLLASQTVNPAADNNYAIRIAAANGHTSVVALLLEHPATNPAARDNEAFRIAVACGHAQLVAILLKHHTQNSRDNEAIKIATEKGYIEIVRLILASSISANYSEVLNIAAGFGHTEIVRLLLGAGVHNNTAIQFAAQKGHTDVVRMLLPMATNLSTLMCIPAMFDIVFTEATRNDAFYTACETAFLTFASMGNCDMIRKLLTVVSVGVRNFEALRSAIFSKKVNVLRECLNHLRESIPADIVLAGINSGNVQIMRMLFPKITPNVAGRVLKDVMKSANLEAICLFIEVHTFLINDAFYLACLMANILCVRVLLTYPGVDPTTHANYAIRFAVKADNIELVRSLLSFGANPTVFDNYPLRFAMRNHRTEMTRVLLEDDRVAKWSKAPVSLDKSSI